MSTPMPSSDRARKHLVHVQGLRGLAVLVVVLYHFNFFFHGGFIGVDMFFVISGFVIGRMLIQELDQSGGINWKYFFFRRARRLIPSLVATLLGTVFLTWALFGAGSVAGLNKSLTSGILFYSNFYFFLQRGYVDLAGDPLRNLWSLSVEEQFYLGLPFLFLFLRLLGGSVRRKLFVTCVIVAVISLAANIILVNYSLQFFVPQFLLPERFAFFSPFTRAWEFLVGFLLVFVPDKKRAHPLKNWFTFSAVVVLVGSSLFLDAWLPFPGWLAIPTVFGAAVLVLFGDQVSSLKTLLSNRLIRFCGDISYSLYLVHWPLLVILQSKFGADSSVTVSALVLSFILAYLMYKFLEVPIRLLTWDKHRLVFGLSIVSIIFPIVLVREAPRFITRPKSVANTVAPVLSESETRQQVINIGSKVCLDVHHKVPMPQMTDCIEGSDNSQPLVFLLGDSHANSASEGVIAAAKRNGIRVMTWSRSGCPFQVTSAVNRLCNGNRDLLLTFIEKSKPDAVIIVNGVNHYLEGRREESFIPRGLRSRLKKNGYLYGETVRYLLERKIPTILMYEVPNMSSDERPLNEFLLRKETIAAENSEIQQVEKELGSKIIRVEPADVLCRSGICRQKQNGVGLYSDGQHLNADGALSLEPLFSAALTEAIKLNDK
jgi:peptidoglycan/LPS O-acetylase OafA/YrhL